MSVCPSAWNNSAPTYFPKICRVSFISDKTNGYFTPRPKYICDHISLSSFRDENVSNKRCREKQNTHFILNQWRTQGGFGCSNPPPRNSEGPPKNRAKLNPIVKTVKKKNAEFRTPAHQDVRKKILKF
jgi:hypothetical protein